MNRLRNIIFCAILLVSGFVATASEVVTKGKAIRNVVSATIKGKEMVYVSEIDGAVSLNGLDGKQLWRKDSDNPALMAEILAFDVTGDKNDDLLGVSSSGTVYCWNHKGDLVWKYKTPSIDRLSEIATVGSGKELRIFAAGNRGKLYELNGKGEQLSETPIKGTVRLLESGNFVDKDKESLFIYTLKHDKFRSELFGFIDPVSKKVIKNGSISKSAPGSFMVQDVDVSDLNGDGKDDILVYGSTNTGVVVALDGNLQTIFKFQGSKDSQRYAHCKGVSLLPLRKEVVMMFGGVMYVVSPEGKLIKRVGQPHQGVIYNDIEFAPKSKMLIGGGQVGGDNTLYTYDLSKNNWADTKHQFAGLYSEVKENLNLLFSQLLKFKLPSYQTKKDKEYVILGIDPKKLDSRVDKLNGGNLLFVTGGGDFSENTSRDDLVAAIGPDALKVDKRRKYQDDRSKIIAWAKSKEEAKEPFQMWVGHGTDPFFIRIETLEGIVKAAPTTCYGFIYAEMDGSETPRNKYFVDEYMPRLAKVIRETGAPTKIYFRYKNMFWAADSHEPGWKKIFFSKKYTDILVPSAEDTNNRLQDLNFSGRVGMFMSGYVDDFAMRLVDDNPTSWRPHAPGGQRSISPYLRNGAIMAAYGSRHGILFDIKYIEKPGYNILFALMKSGVIPVVERQDILSAGSYVAVKDVDEDYVKLVSDGHDITNAKDSDIKPFVAAAQVSWCGFPIQDHDYSKIAMGLDYRWLNFMPLMPNGMVPITDFDSVDELKKAGENFVVTNIKDGIVGGKKVEGKEFAPLFKKSVEEGGNRLLMRVKGASWGLFRINKTHARLILVDPGYVDPFERDVEISLQNTMPKGATDILSGEKIVIKNGKISLKVPAGSMRFIDFEYPKAI